MNLPPIAALVIFVTLSAVEWNIQPINMYFVPLDQVNKPVNNQVRHKPPLPVVVTKVTSLKQNDICKNIAQDSFLPKVVNSSIINDVSFASSIDMLDSFGEKIIFKNNVLEVGEVVSSEIAVSELITEEITDSLESLCLCVEVGCLKCIVQKIQVLHSVVVKMT